MKLIDLLVQELPKRGGWVHGVKHAWCDPDGEVRFRDGGCKPDFYPEAEVDDECRIPSYRHEDDPHYIVTSEQYEAAIAAAQQPVWDGEGFPPVGCECERSWCGDKWLRCTVLFVSDETIVVKLPTRENAYRRNDVKFRPLRSEADKKRAEGVIALSRVDPSVAPFEYGAKHSDGSLIGPFWYELYDAIAAGKIPHIRIE
ncbi:hypothetical protein [Cronobacter dublinensis]|uniref:hypothetical protein n=1 Tax=Cronobacter dublinensis TaxID=413497 RepID=UPI0024AFBBE0|nr:hypothetical protein [Cronobacter dublinensis]MDI7502012.1 hypothetical protein [Cronobacter dublinensis]